MAVVERADPLAIDADHVDTVRFRPGLGSRPASGRSTDGLSARHCAGGPRAGHRSWCRFYRLGRRGPCVAGFRRHASVMQPPAHDRPPDPAAQRAADWQRFRRAAGASAFFVAVLAVVHMAQSGFARACSRFRRRVGGCSGSSPRHCCMARSTHRRNSLAVLLLGTRRLGLPSRRAARLPRCGWARAWCLLLAIRLLAPVASGVPTA